MFPLTDMQHSKFPLHPAQQDVYVDQLLHAGSPHYNIGGYIKLKGPLDKGRFLEAVNSGPKVFDVFKARFDLHEPEMACYFDAGYEKLEMGELDFCDRDDPQGAAAEGMQKIGR